MVKVTTQRSSTKFRAILLRFTTAMLAQVSGPWGAQAPPRKACACGGVWSGLGGVRGRCSPVLVQTPLQSKQQSCNISLDNRCYFLL